MGDVRVTYIHSDGVIAVYRQGDLFVGIAKTWDGDTTMLAGTDQAGVEQRIGIPKHLA